MGTRHRTASSEVEGLILGAALKLLDDQGLTALTVRGIASEAGIAPMGIYNRFDGKMGIVEALWVEGFERLSKCMEGRGDTGDPRQDLYACGQAYREFALANRSHYRLMFMEHHQEFTPSSESALVAARAINALVGRIERAQGAGLIATSIPPMMVAQIFWASVHGFVSLELINMGFCEDYPYAYDRLLASIFDGLGPRP